VPHALVVGKCDCGCPTVDLVVPSEASSSPVTTHSRLAPEGQVRPIADGPVADIILFVDEGRLSRLELVSYSDPDRTEWPPMDTVAVERLDSS